MPFKSSARGAYGPQGQKVIKGPLAPVWVNFSPGSVGTEAFSYTFLATDDSGDTPTYSVASGSLPNGLTLNSSTGVLSGTATVSGTFTYTLRATDVNGRFTDTTSISQVVALALYSMSFPVTFNNAGASGRFGPSLAQMQSTYSSYGAWATNTSYLYQGGNGIQYWVVPADGTYSFTLAGGVGGSSSSPSRSGGSGAVFTTTHSLLKSQTLRLQVGQIGQLSADSEGGSGGGGTVVYNNTTGVLLAIAGGGGGSGDSEDGQNAVNTTNGGQGGLGGGGGGSNGSGGGQGTYSAGGAGWTGDGGNASSRSAYGGSNLSGGGVGGAAENTSNGGGYGGGGGGGSNNGYGGGAGGYSGGGGGTCCGGGGGGYGGSYSSTSITNFSGSNRGHGYIIVNKIS